MTASGYLKNITSRHSGKALTFYDSVNSDWARIIRTGLTPIRRGSVQFDFRVIAGGTFGFRETVNLVPYVYIGGGAGDFESEHITKNPKSSQRSIQYLVRLGITYISTSTLMQKCTATMWTVFWRRQSISLAIIRLLPSIFWLQRLHLWIRRYW